MGNVKAVKSSESGSVSVRPHKRGDSRDGYTSIDGSIAAKYGSESSDVGAKVVLSNNELVQLQLLGKLGLGSSVFTGGVDATGSGIINGYHIGLNAPVGSINGSLLTAEGTPDVYKGDVHTKYGDLKLDASGKYVPDTKEYSANVAAELQGLGALEYGTDGNIKATAELGDYGKVIADAKDRELKALYYELHKGDLSVRAGADIGKDGNTYKGSVNYKF